MFFEYKAITPDGGREEGKLEADNATDAARALTQQGFRVLHIEEKRKSAFDYFKRKILNRPLGDKKIALFCRQLAILLEIEPLHRILYILEQDSKDANYTSMIRDIREQIEEGHPLYKALRRHDESFSKSAISLIEAGEESGELRGILERIANYSEKQADAQEKFRGALIYPALLTFATFGLLTLMFVFIIPTFAALYQSLDAPLPLPTRIAISIGNFVSGNGFSLILAIALLIVGFFYCLQNENFKIQIDKFILKIPLWGEFIKHAAWSKICVTMAMLIRGGFRPDEAVLMAAEVSENLVLKKFLNSASKGLKEGRSLAAVLRGFKHIPNSHFQLITAGEKSGRLEEMFLKAAEFSDKETGYILKRTESMIAPVLTLLVGGAVLFFALSVVLPIFNLTEFI